MYKSLISTFIIVCVSLFACTGYHWNYNFSLDEAYRQSDLKGWEFEPKIEAYAWIPRGADSLLADKQYFSIRMEFEIPNKKSIDLFYDIRIENVTIGRFVLETKDTLTVTNSHYWSYGSSMFKNFYLEPKNPPATTIPAKNRVFIPLDVDSIQFEFDAILRAGERVTFSRSGPTKYPDDSVAVFENSQQIRVPVSVTLYRRHEKLGTTVGLLNRNLNN